MSTPELTVTSRKPLARDPEPVAPKRKDGLIQLTHQQSLKISQFYEFVARCLPTEGRDYKVTFSPDPDTPDGVKADIKGLTEFGRAFVTHVVKAFQKSMPKEGQNV